MSLHRIRSRLVRHRTALINQIRGMLMERGVTVRKGQAPMRAALVEILSQPPSDLSPRIQRLLCDLSHDWRRLDDRIAMISDEIAFLADNDVACQRLIMVPGIGVITASATVAAIGNGDGLKQGRDFAAWIGLVPRQESTGGRTKLGRLAHRNLQATALANKLARIAWAVLVRGHDYRPEASADVA